MRALIIFFISILMVSCEVYQQPKNVISEEQEFENLVIKDAEDREQRAANAVNLFLNDDPKNTEAAVLISNKTNCNIIVRIRGKKNFDVPVYKNNINYIVLEKETYDFSSKFCSAKYFRTKIITESIKVELIESR